MTGRGVETRGGVGGGKAETTTSLRETKMHCQDQEGKRETERERRSQCACIACATRIDQSFANYARDFFLP